MKNILLISFQIVLGFYAPAILAQPKPETLKPISQKYNLNSVIFKDTEVFKPVKTIKANVDPFTTNPLFAPDPSARYNMNWNNNGDNNNSNLPFWLRSVFNRR
jgi:hypothetical protein